MHVYKLTAFRGSVEFEPMTTGVPGWLTNCDLAAIPQEANLEIVCRLGDPELAECVVLRRQKGMGGIFLLQDQTGPLFGAMAATNLDYVAALGHFGVLLSSVRYGADVFEQRGESDA